MNANVKQTRTRWDPDKQKYVVEEFTPEEIKENDKKKKWYQKPKEGKVYDAPKEKR